MLSHTILVANCRAHYVQKRVPGSIFPFVCSMFRAHSPNPRCKFTCIFFPKWHIPFNLKRIKAKSTDSFASYSENKTTGLIWSPIRYTAVKKSPTCTWQMIEGFSRCSYHIQIARCVYSGHSTWHQHITMNKIILLLVLENYSGFVWFRRILSIFLLWVSIRHSNNNFPFLHALHDCSSWKKIVTC